MKPTRKDLIRILQNRVIEQLNVAIAQKQRDIRAMQQTAADIDESRRQVAIARYKLRAPVKRYIAKLEKAGLSYQFQASIESHCRVPTANPHCRHMKVWIEVESLPVVLSADPQVAVVEAYDDNKVQQSTLEKELQTLCNHRSTVSNQDDSGFVAEFVQLALVTEDPVFNALLTRIENNLMEALLERSKQQGAAN